MQLQIIRRAHERGHFSVAKTEAILRNDYCIPNVKPKIEKVVKNCVVCILAERKQGSADSKSVWLYATKTTNASEVINILKKQSCIFGNPRRIVSDRGAAFTSNDFSEYCTKENIEHVLITTGVPRAKGQTERLNRVLIPLLTKLADPDREKWYKYLETAQQCINTTVSRSIGMTPFQLLFGVRARLRDDPEIMKLLE